MPTIGIYSIISPTKKIYVGKSINIEGRFKSYAKLNCKSQPKLYNSLKKYGWEAHEKHIFQFPEDQLNNTEQYFIAWYATVHHGLNCMKGGGGCTRPTEEQRKRMGESKKDLLAGEKNPMWGKKWSQERKDARKKWLDENKESIREKARISSTGRVYSKESREKKSKSLMGHTVSDSVKQRLREARSKPVLQFDLNGIFVKEFPSAKEARLQTGSKNVSECAKGDLKTSGGYIWKYK